MADQEAATANDAVRRRQDALLLQRQEQLTESAYYGDVDAVKEVLRVVGLNIDAVDANGDTALICAARNGHATVCTILVDNGAYVNFTTQRRSRSTALINAAFSGHATVCIALLNKGAALDLKDRDGFTALIGAARNGHVEVCDILLNNGAAVDLTNKDGDTALISAVHNGRLDVCFVLLDKGAALDLTDKSGRTALQLAASYRNYSIADAICQHADRLQWEEKELRRWAASGEMVMLIPKLAVAGLNVDGADETGCTGLIWAAIGGHSSAAVVLLEKGASVHVIDKTGRTALIYAAIFGHTEVCTILVDRGAVVDGTDTAGNTPLIQAAEFGHAATCTALLDRGACGDLKNKVGNTALIGAARIGRGAVCTVLLDKGVAVDLTNKDGDTALMIAARYGRAEMCTTLLGKGASVELTNKAGQTALQVAEACGRTFSPTGNVIRQATWLQGHQRNLARESAGDGNVAVVQAALAAAGINLDAVDERGSTALICAARNGHAAVCVALLKKGAAVDMRGFCDETALMAAAGEGHAAVCTALLDEGAAGLNLRDEAGDTALICAAENGHAAVCTVLVDDGAALHLANKEGNTALICAARHGHEAVCTVLLDNLAPVHLADLAGNTALIWAASNGHAAVCTALLDYRADVDVTNEDGNTALICAAESGHAAVCTALLGKDAAVDLTNNDGNTALICAADRGHAAVCRTLLDKGAAADFTDEDGNTALIRAASYGHVAVCRALLDSGAAVDLADKDGNTALIYAAESGHAAVCTVLLDKGAAVGLTDKSGKTALQLAEASGHTATADALIQRGARLQGQKQLRESASSGNVAAVKDVLGMAGLDVDAVDEDGNTALICAARNGHAAVCTVLLDKGAVVELTDEHGNSALAHAVAKGHMETADLVLKACCERMPAADWTLEMALERAQKQQQNQNQPVVVPKSRSCPQLLRHLGLVQYLRSATQPSSAAPAAAADPASAAAAVPAAAATSAAGPAAAPAVADSAAAALQLGRQLQQLLDGAVPAVAESQPDVVAEALDTVKKFDSAQEALFKLSNGEASLPQDTRALAIRARDAAAATARDRVEPMIPKLTEARDWWAGRRRALQQILERVTELQAVVGVGGVQLFQEMVDEQTSTFGAEQILPTRMDVEGGEGEGVSGDGDMEMEDGVEECKEQDEGGIQVEEGPAAATGLTLPALASGPSSAGAALDSAWEGYRAACAALIGQEDSAMGLGLGMEPAPNFGGEAAGEIPVLARLLSSATATEAAGMEQGWAASELVVRMRVAEEEALHVAGQLRRVALKQTRACAETVRRELAGVTKSEARSEAALARATNALGRVTKFLSAQHTQAVVCGALQAALDSRYAAEDGVDGLSRAVSRARERHHLATVSELEPKLAEATAELRSILRSTQYRGALAAARDLLLHLPELAKQFPVLDPFRGTAAQGLEERDFSEYVDVEPLVCEGGGVNSSRHLILKASCPAAQEGGEGDANRWCVLKGFTVADEKRLRRELHALSCLSHPNIIPLRGICRQRDPTRYFVELPYYPHNLQQWLVARDEVQESKEERNLAVTGLLKGVLEGLEYLHQNGVLHRDLKPENILVTAEDTPVIADFETSVSSLDASSNVTVTRTFVSSGYSAPEVAREGHSQASDMYAFGLVVAQALLGLRVPPAEIPGAVRECGTVGETGAGGPPRLDEEQLGVLEGLLSPEAGQRPSAASLLHSSTLLRVRRVRTCVICLADDIPLLDGLECAGGSGGGGDRNLQQQGTAAAHFTCKSCFSTYITSQSEEELQKLERRGGEVLCPKRLSSECASPAYSDAEVAALCSPEVFAVYVGQRVRLAESQLASEMERDHAKKLEAELARLREMDERTRRVETMAARVRELLNNACPRCKAVFVDFDACSALTCHRCNAAFCAWCLADCGNDAHPHVRNCNMNPGRELFGTQEQWLQSCRRRFRADVTALLDGLVERGEESIAAEVAGAVRRELNDLRIGDIVDMYT